MKRLIGRKNRKTMKKPVAFLSDGVVTFCTLVEDQRKVNRPKKHPKWVSVDLLLNRVANR